MYRWALRISDARVPPSPFQFFSLPPTDPFSPHGGVCNRRRVYSYASNWDRSLKKDEFFLLRKNPKKQWEKRQKKTGPKTDFWNCAIFFLCTACPPEGGIDPIRGDLRIFFLFPTNVGMIQNDFFALSYRQKLSPQTWGWGQSGGSALFYFWGKKIPG